MTNAQPSPPVDGGRDILTILLVFVAVGILLIAGLAVILLSFAPDPEPHSPPPQPADPSEPFDPAAPAPAPAPTDSIIDCGQPCFSVEDARALEPTREALSTLGSPALVERLGDAGIQSDWEAQANEAFYLGDGAPQACVFALSPAPIAPHSQSYMTGDDPVVDLGTYSSGALTVTHMARVSESVLWGTRYPNTIRSSVDRCPGYSVSLDGVPRDVTVEPLDLELALAGVTDVAWTQSGDGTRTTTADLQRGNLIVRVSIVGDSSTVSDAAVVDYLAGVALELSELPAP